MGVAATGSTYVTVIRCSIAAATVVVDAATGIGVEQLMMIMIGT